ncbi:MAG TPA: metalloregulator ArsR/SmtB family transcription factor [Acidimicrobiia bacterium]|jgi:DNA-binding transcriptional ArsR family regulator|nr:metalloregulator ArsR/SmtB family transcription factor [Acidimicrobiia bacterium]
MSVEAVFTALADSTRRLVLQRVAERGDVTATELAADLPVSRQAVSKHLDALGAAGLILGSKVGREVQYRVTPEPLTGAVRWMLEVGSEWDERVTRLRSLLQADDGYGVT